MATMQKRKTWRRGRPRPADVQRPDVPYTMKLPDGRTIYVEIPGRWVTQVRGYGAAFRPEAVAFLDRIRALAVGLTRTPSPGFITSLREALGLTQAKFGKRIGVDKMTVSRWERGTLRPSDESLAAMERERSAAVGEGVVLPG